MNPTAFRTAFREFFDPTRYPDALIQTYLTLAALFVNTDRFLELSDYVTGLVTAHFLALDDRAAATAASGGVNTIAGPMTAKSIDKVSVSYDANSIMLEGIGDFGTTPYGLRYTTLARRFAAGGVQL